MKLQRSDQEQILLVTSSAAIANIEVAGGRLIPVIMVDLKNRADVRELIRAHEHTPPGDCVSQWLTPVGSPEAVLLQLEFERPVATSFLIRFQLPKFAGAVDNILRSKSMYLLEGEEGSTYSSTEGQPRILLELPATGFEPTWQQIFRKAISGMFRSEGASRARSRTLADEFIANWRSGTTFDL